MSQRTLSIEEGKFNRCKYVFKMRAIDLLLSEKEEKLNKNNNYTFHFFSNGKNHLESNECIYFLNNPRNDL